MTITAPAPYGTTAIVETPETNTLDWLRLRQTGLGASETPAVLGMSPWSSPREVWSRKRSDRIDDEQTEAMEFGHLMESVAFEVFRRRHADPDSTRHRYLGSIERSPGLLRSREHPTLLASPDSVIVEADGQRVPGQMKNVTAYKRGAWAESEGGVPDYVRVQVIQEALLMGADHGWVLPIFGGNSMPEPIRIDVDREFVAWYVPEVETWWAECVVGGAEPTLSILDDVSERAFHGIAGAEVLLPPDMVEHVHEHRRLRDVVKQHEGEREAHKLAVLTWLVQNGHDTATELFEAIESESGVPRSRLAATWRPEKAPRTRLDTAQMKADHPDLIEAYTIEAEHRRTFLSK